MSEVEKLKLQRESLDRQIAEAERAETAAMFRASFKRLAEDDSLPLLEILKKTLKKGEGPSDESLRSLADRLKLTLMTYGE